MIIGLTGYAQVGKDTFASFLPEFRHLAFADSLRNIVADLNPVLCVRQNPPNFYKEPDYEHYNVVVKHRSYEWAKANTDLRDQMVRLGEAVRTHLGADIFRRVVAEELVYLKYETDVVVTDVRYPNEADMITQFGGIIVHVVRPGHGPANETEAESIREVTEGCSNLRTIENNGDLDLFRLKALHLVGSLR